MVQSLKLGGSGQERGGNQKPGAGIRRLNRLPVIVAIALAVAFFAVILFNARLKIQQIICCYIEVSSNLFQNIYFY